MNRQRGLAVVAALTLLVMAPAGVAIAQTLTHSATAGVTYTTNSGVSVELGDARDVPAVPFADDQTFADGDLTVSGSDAELQVTDNTYAGDPLVLRQVDVTGELTVTRADLSRSVTITSGDLTGFQLQTVAVGDGSTDFSYSSADGATIRLSGLPNNRVGIVDADTGDVFDTGDARDDGTATFELPAGTNTVELQKQPGILEVRNEARPDELIDGNVSLRVRLFASNETVVERQVTDGTVSLEGVPTDERLVITVREENADFTYRRILIESAFQSPEIYLLPTSEPSAEVRFQLQDETGRFDSQDTRLFVEKPITRNNNTEYRVISGDRLGADGEFPTILVDSTRYRLRVENDAGEQRVLGSYTVQGAQIARIPIGEVQFNADVSEGAAVQAGLREAPEGASHNHEVRLVYLDPEGETDDMTVQITNASGTTLRPETTESVGGSTSAYVETYPLPTAFDPEEDTATVTVEAQRGAAIETFTRTLGDVPDVLADSGIDTQVLELIGLVSIVAVAGLLVIVSPPTAALVTPGYAGLLTITGIVPIPLPAVVLAGVVGVLATVGTRRR